MKHIFLIIGLSLYDVAQSAPVEGVYKYSSFGMETETRGDPLFIMIGQRPTKMPPFVGAGSEVKRAEFCDREDANICVTSDKLTFSVPKMRVKKGASWEFKNVTFSVSGELNVEMLGREFGAYRIIARSADSIRWVFVYSYEIGLVLIEEYAETREHPVVYVLAGEAGFGGVAVAENQ